MACWLLVGCSAWHQGVRQSVEWSASFATTALDRPVPHVPHFLDRVVESTLSLGDGTRLIGATGPQDAATGPLPLLYARDLSASKTAADLERAAECTPGTLDASKVPGPAIIVSQQAVQAQSQLCLLGAGQDGGVRFHGMSSDHLLAAFEMCAITILSTNLWTCIVCCVRCWSVESNQ